MSNLSHDIKSITGTSSIIRKARALEVISICQVVAIFAIIGACIFNLSIGDEKSVLWSSLLSGALGYLLPSPKVHRNVRVLFDPSIQQQYGDLSLQHANPLRDQIAIGDFIDGGLGGSASGDQHTAVVVHDI